jgi:Ca2+-binding RTX toxin-like protein
VLRGTAKRDVICGLGGSDRIYAGAGDIVVAGGGNDTIYARTGAANLLFGGMGVDRATIDAGDLTLSIERSL